MKPERSFSHSWLYIQFTVQRLIFYILHMIWKKIRIWTFVSGHHFQNCPRGRSSIERGILRAARTARSLIWWKSVRFDYLPNVGGNKTTHILFGWFDHMILSKCLIGSPHKEERKQRNSKCFHSKIFLIIYLGQLNYFQNWGEFFQFPILRFEVVFRC